MQELHLLSTPFAVNLDGIPGPDGLALKIYASGRDQSQSIPITNGALEVLMYDGLLQDTDSAVPRQTWTFRAEELKRFEFKSFIGPGYQLAVPWRDKKPTKARLTVVARYIPPEGAAIYSSPSIISLSK